MTTTKGRPQEILVIPVELDNAPKGSKKLPKAVSCEGCSLGCLSCQTWDMRYPDALEALLALGTINIPKEVSLAGVDRLLAWATERAIIWTQIAQRKLQEERNAPAEPALLQGHTMEQWEFIRKEGFLCEFSQTADFANPAIGKLETSTPEPNYKRTPFITKDAMYAYCRPLRTKGVKQPWFGGECPVSEDSWVVVYFKNGSTVKLLAKNLDWSISEILPGNIIAFIEL